MSRGIIYFLLVQSIVCKVFAIYAPPTIQQYLHLTAGPHTTHQASVPPTHNPATINQATYNHAPPTNQQRSSTGLPSFSSLALPNLVSGLQQLPEQPKATDIKCANPSNIDANVLNNLAIALQLLIVSNILNAPPADLPTAKPELKELRTYSEPVQTSNYNYKATVPNSNFVGTSNYAEANFVQNVKPTRNSMFLMSPYEALGSNSLYSDPVPQYSSANPRMNFQSPYAMMDQDSFSMHGLF